MWKGFHNQTRKMHLFRSYAILICVQKRQLKKLFFSRKNPLMFLLIVLKGVLTWSTRRNKFFLLLLKSLKLRRTRRFLHFCQQSCVVFEKIKFMRPSSNDLTADMDVLSIPPLSFGERFEDVYEVILILDDREQFTSQGARSKKMLEKICAEFKIKINLTYEFLITDDEMLRRINSPSMSKNLNTDRSQRVLQMNQRTLGEWLKKEPIRAYSPSSDLSSPSPLSPLTLAPAPKMVNFLSALRGLSPKLIVITEQESKHNGSTLMERVMEALNFYAALFDCLESTVSRAPIERQKVEKMLFGEELRTS
ncbi:uncharacterized protein LOC120116799 [Hibiscus syriacus]|uniref:uncharacterized protein LOC120116799 n=1 Tax=Hibiscus syriacus TaxID=106335 RepID=UPI0019213082|nr:uncharacterized protein LOC120116799 [Hibiscus syriacus]